MRSLAERMIDNVISGAIFDFAGYLTTLDDTLKCGASNDASPMVDHIRRWSSKRDLHLDDARVQDWNTVLNRIVDGESTEDIIDELTTTLAIAKYPKPMGVVRSSRKRKRNEAIDALTAPAGNQDFSRSDTSNPWSKKLRRRKQQRNCKLESLLGRAHEFLLERKRAPTMFMYHGTSTKFLRSILKQGLVPSPKMRVWQDDKSAQKQVTQHTRKALDSVYFAENFLTAVSSGGNAHRKFGGTYLFVAAQIQPRSSYADEDTVGIRLKSAIASVLGYSDSRAMDWWENVGLDNWGYKGAEIAKKLGDEMARTALPFGIGSRAKKIPIDVKGVTDAYRGLVEQGIAKEYRERGDDLIWDHMWRTKSNYATSKATDEQRQQVFDSLKKQMPTFKQGEDRYLKGMERLTVRYKDLAKPSKDELGWFSHTLRVPEPVTYRGRSKIVSVFQAFSIDRSYFIVTHYGRMTPKIVSDMNKASWSDPQAKIITAREAKKIGLIDKNNIPADKLPASLRKVA